jgi:hypothetical protein
MPVLIGNRTTDAVMAWLSPYCRIQAKEQKQYNHNFIYTHCNLFICEQPWLFPNLPTANIMPKCQILQYEGKIKQLGCTNKYPTH